jgi:hypothetical protein
MKRLIALNLILIGCLLCSGCSVVHNSLRPSGKSSQWNLFNRGTAEKSASTKKEMPPPENMVVIWKDAVLEKTGTTSVRGFGARIFFHDAENQAVKVEGDLVVFGFDDSGSDGTLLTKRPTKKFVFTNEQFQTHYSESNLGASYSIWIPWDKVGEGQKTIALIPVFRTKAGLTLNGGSTTNVLPSDKTVEEDKNLISIEKKRKQSNKNQVTQAGFSTEDRDGQGTTQAVMNEDVPPKSGIKSTTIHLTPSMSSFLSQPTATEQSSADQPTKPLSKDASQKGLPLTKLATVPGMDKTSAVVTEKDSNQPIFDPANEIDRKGNASHTIKKSPVFGAPGSFR